MVQGDCQATQAGDAGPLDGGDDREHGLGKPVGFFDRHEIAGDEVRFETIEGAALRQCPVCLVGEMVEKRDRNGTVFRGCNQFPDCKHGEGGPAQPSARLRRRA
ncbi:MAG: hypothetical protein EOQ33_29710 [Mesorhizobium sp.]|nr:MAG: hypothetical protein EOQ33_29710 [Mesorhizobium sp.]